MLCISVVMNGKPILVVGHEKAESAQASVLMRNNKALVYGHGTVAMTPDYKQTRAWGDAIDLKVGDTLTFTLIEGELAQEGRVTGHFGRTSGPDKPEFSCAFCAKSQKQVKTLFAGPGVGICNECVAFFQQASNAKR